jgi:hypothetical protein
VLTVQLLVPPQDDVINNSVITWAGVGAPRQLHACTLLGSARRM